MVQSNVVGAIAENWAKYCRSQRIDQPTMPVIVTKSLHRRGNILQQVSYKKGNSGNEKGRDFRYKACTKKAQSQKSIWHRIVGLLWTGIWQEGHDGRNLTYRIEWQKGVSLGRHLDDSLQAKLESLDFIYEFQEGQEEFLLFCLFFFINLGWNIVVLFLVIHIQWKEDV